MLVPRISPEDIKATIRTFPQEIQKDRSRRIFILATTIVSHFFGREWVEANVIQDETGSRGPTFFRLDFTSDAARESKSFRLVDFAETLFNLQHIEGFDSRVDQMRSGQVESTYAEFDFARFLYIHDINFRFVQAIGQRGSDYDVAITYPDGRTACADAKCRLEGTEIRIETIRYGLEHARSHNLPKSEPGIIFLKLPPSWLETPERRRGLRDEVNDFLRRTERIVDVVLYASVVTPLSEQIRNYHQFEEFENSRHRFDMKKSWLLFRDFDVPPEWNGMPPKWVRVFSHG